MSGAGVVRWRRRASWTVVGAGLLALATWELPVTRPVERSDAVAVGGAPGPEPTSVPDPTAGPDADPRPAVARRPDPASEPSASPAGGEPVTLALAGDVHFERHLAALPGSGKGLGPLGRTLAEADVAMLNLESAVTDRGRPDPKEREEPGRRYHFRTPPAALDLLAAAGVDVVSMANNHGADYGPVGLRDSLRAARAAPLAVVGIGADRRRAFAPHVVDVRGTTVALLAADSSLRESRRAVWSAGPGQPGVAAARGDRPSALLRAVRRADRRADVVVVYLHWGAEYRSCPTRGQRDLASALARAGADVVVGTHAHVLLGGGWQGDTYVGYGLGGFVWYHDARPETGVLVLRVRDGRVVADEWVPGLIRPDGRPRPLAGGERREARAAWQRLRGCTGLDRRATMPPFRATVSRVDRTTAERMRGRSHRPGCPVPLADLRVLTVRHVGLDGRPRTGEVVVATRYADDVVGVFERLYDARWPVRRLRPVHAYGGDDDRSMAANNSSGYNCRRVAGQRQWSKHAYGAAIDLNPVQNPYLRPGRVDPTAGRRFADVDRARDGVPAPGVVRRGDVVVRAFAEIGWEWGGDFAQPDYQHFAAPDAP
jgi:poly-gamma-glutamate capsule biosynthesis protein CapA/YwtB (metallophosphatase superfamily)